MKSINPLSSVLQTILLAFQGRIHFPRQRVGDELWLDGEHWIIFRQVIIDPVPGQPGQPGAIFRPRFRLAGMSPRVNILFSWIPVWFILGLPGFRSKLWLINPQNGEFSGYYEWDTVADAERYGQSFAAAFMTRRSIPGSVSFQTIPIVDQPAAAVQEASA